jgi:hypothetical protein
MGKMLKICLAVLPVALLGCVSGNTSGAPCYDGWTTEQTASRVVSPSPELLSFLRSRAGIDQSALQCVHELPAQGKYIALVRAKSGIISAVSVHKVGNGFEYLDSEIVY